MKEEIGYNINDVIEFIRFVARILFIVVLLTEPRLLIIFLLLIIISPKEFINSVKHIFCYGY